MTHDHDSHTGHDHGVSADADRRWIAIALGLIVAFMFVEFAVGLIANSLALISDAFHMLTDAMAIGLALIALRVAQRPAKGRYTFGFGRVEILSAQVNGASLLVLGGLVAFEALQRLFHPPDVVGGLVIVVGIIGALVNVAAAWALSRAQRRSLNLEGARAHVLADLYASVAAVVAGVIIVLTDYRAKPTQSRRWSSRRSCSEAAARSCATARRCCWRPLRRGWIRRRSDSRWPRTAASARYTICTSGR